MDDLHEVCSDLKDFSWWLFGECARQDRTRRHLGVCVEARLHDGARKTHQPAGQRLALSDADADALRQRINRGYLSDWPDAAVRARLARVAHLVMPEAFALIVDDTGIVKKGKKSPGVQRQYTGTAGKVTNCQIIVSTHLSSWDSSVPLEMDLYLPDENWCRDRQRRAEAGIPAEVVFRTKTQIALDQVRHLVSEGTLAKTVLADSAYGDNTAFRQALDELGLTYALGLSSTLKVWRPEQGPADVGKDSGVRRPPRHYIGDDEPVELRKLATEIPAGSWKLVELRPGEANPRTSRFAALRVRSAHRASHGKPPGPERWLVFEWPEGDSAPSHYFLSSMPADTELAELARVAKHRWRVERDYQDAKQEVGLEHYEGRRWVGFNHHLTICMAAMTYLVASRALFPPRDHAIAG